MIRPRRKAGCRISARSQDILKEYVNGNEYRSDKFNIQVEVIIDTYHNPSTMFETGLVNRGTIFDVVSDLKP